EAARRERAAAVARRLAPIDDNAAIARADVVRVEIEGETDLPSEYTAGEDGAIRLPLLGRFAVQGRTPADLASDIRGALTRSGLKPDAAVRVQVLRARGPVRRGLKPVPGRQKGAHGLQPVRIPAPASSILRARSVRHGLKPVASR